jgi:PRTRC genetic system protein A
LMETRKLPFGVYTSVAKDPLIEVPLLTLKEGLDLTIPKLPWTEFCRIVTFFRAVSKKHNSEAIVQVFYRENAWILHVPKQKVGPASVDHEGKFDQQGEFLHVMDVHSHVNMTGFFSGTDDSDEKKAVRLYGVIGKIDSKIPESRWRVWTGKEFLNLDIAQVVEMPEEMIVTPVPLAEFLRSGNTEVKAALHDTFDPFRGAEFPAQWMEQVERESSWVGQVGFGDSYADWDDLWHRGNAFGASGQGHGHGTVIGGGPRAGQHFLPAANATFYPHKDDEAEALAIAGFNTDKLVYLVHNGRIWRIDEGETRLTGMTVGHLNSMKNHTKKSVLILTTTAQGGLQVDFGGVEGARGATS